MSPEMADAILAVLSQMLSQLEEISRQLLRFEERARK
jgi:hypothetical protein